MAEGGLSTSPAVNFSTATVFCAAADRNRKYTDENGDTVLVEGKPSLLDHIAVCDKGVWDKGGPASGVNTAKADSEMTEDEKKARDDAAAKADAAKADQARKDADDERWNKVMGVLDSVSKRMDSYDEERKADRAKADKAKADADEEEKKANEAANEPGAGDPDEVERKKSDKKADAKKDSDDDKKPEFLKKDAKKDAKKDSDDEDDKKPEDSAKADAARADSESRMASMQREMEELKRRLNASVPTDEDYASIAQAHARADSVHAMFGGRATRHQPGETPLAYRRRLVNEFKDKSKTWKDFDLANLGNSNAFAVAEDQIYADAIVAARSPVGLPEGQLREIRRTDSGREIIEFAGQPRDWMRDFSGTRGILCSLRSRQQ